MKPTASLSLDLDDKWSYMKTHGDTGWESYPSYLNLVVPRILDFFHARDLSITVFIVGQDAALHKNQALLGAIAAAGHEIGNHSFHHEPWLHLYSEQEIATEIALAEASIVKATGQKPVGFRGPGFSLSSTTLQELERRGYLYDATTYPNFANPIIRAYYFTTAKFSPEEKKRRALLGGTFAEGFRPITPYRWQSESRSMIEIPVTTMPILRVPIHLSYLICLALISPALARQYFKTALWLCRLTGTQPSLLLHPTDFLSNDDTKDLAFFPGMNWPSIKKIKLVGEIIDVFRQHFSVVTLRQHAREAAQSENLRVCQFPQNHTS